MALGYGSEGTGGGFTNASRGMAGGYGGIKSASSPMAKTNSRLTGDAHLYDYKNQNLATHNKLMDMYSTNSSGSAGGGAPAGGGVGGGLGFSAQNENDMINKATEEISVGQDEAKRAATERAAALGFSRSGGTEEAMQRIDSAAAGDKANAARDVRIASANLGYEREQADADRAERNNNNLSSIRAQIEKNGQAMASQNAGFSGGKGGGGGGGGKPAAQVVGGGAGNLAPLAGGGWAQPGQAGNTKRPQKNSERSTF